MSISKTVLSGPFTRWFVGVIAPTASYALIPVVTHYKLKQSPVSKGERKLLVAQEVSRQTLNILITLVTFKAGGDLGKIVFEKLFKQKLASPEHREMAKTIGVVAANFIAYTFIRPFLSWEMFDRWVLWKRKNAESAINPAEFSRLHRLSNAPLVRAESTPEERFSRFLA